MAITSFWFGKAIINAFGGETAGESIAIDYLSDTIKVALFTSSATMAQDTTEFYGDLSDEVSDSGTNYTTGGAVLGSKTLGYTALTNVVKFSGANTTWASSTITARYAVLYADSGDPSTSPVLGYVDFGQDYTSSSGDFTISWSADGILTVTCS